MSNVVEFVLKLKDLMSGGMMKVAATTNSSMSGMQRSVGRTTRSISDMNRRLDDLRKTRELSVDSRQIRAANREMERLEHRRDRLENMGRRRSGGGGGMLGMLGVSGGAAAGLLAATAITAGTGASIGAALRGSQQKASFQVLAGQQQGGKLYGDITKFAQDSIFGNELYKNAQTLLSFGINSKKIMPDLKMLGDVSMGDAEKLGSLTLAFSQTQSAGRLMGQDLLQYVNTGFNPLKEISDMTGQSMAVLKKRMEDGAISASMVQAAFEHATGPTGKFFKMTEKIAETPFGKWEAFKGQIQGLALQFGTALLPAVSKVLGILPPLLESITPMLMKLVPIFTSLANIAMTALVPALKVVSAVLNVVLDIVGPVIKGVAYIIEKVFSIFDSEHIEAAYEDAGEMSGKSYVSGVASEVKDVKKVIAAPINDGSVAQAWRAAGTQSAVSFMDATREKIETFDMRVPVTVIPMVDTSSPIGGMIVDANGRLQWAKKKPIIPDDTPHSKALFDAYFGTGTVVPSKTISYAGGAWQGAFKAPKKIKADTLRLASDYFKVFGAKKYEPNGSAPVAAAGGTSPVMPGFDSSGSDNSSRAIAGGGRKQIIINVNREMIAGGITINAKEVKGGLDDMERQVSEVLLRILNSANAVAD